MITWRVFGWPPQNCVRLKGLICCADDRLCSFADVQAEQDANLQAAEEALEETEAATQAEEEADTDVDNFRVDEVEDAEEGVND